jgi:hypothetical protein
MTSPKWRGLLSGSSASSLAARRPGCSGCHQTLPHGVKSILYAWQECTAINKKCICGQNNFISSDNWDICFNSNDCMSHTAFMLRIYTIYLSIKWPRGIHFSTQIKIYNIYCPRGSKFLKTVQYLISMVKLKVQHQWSSGNYEDFVASKFWWKYNLSKMYCCRISQSDMPEGIMHKKLF